MDGAELRRPLPRQDNAVDRSVTAPTEVAPGHPVSPSRLFVNDPREACQNRACRLELIEARVHAPHKPGHEREFVVRLVAAQEAGMGEWLAVPECELAAEEELPRGRD